MMESFHSDVQDTSGDLLNLDGTDSSPISVVPVDRYDYHVPSFDISTDGLAEDDDSGVVISSLSIDYPEELHSSLGPVSDRNVGNTPVTNLNRTSDAGRGAYELVELPVIHNVRGNSVDSTFNDAINDTATPSKSLTPYNKFLERLKDESCIEIIRAVKGLLAMSLGTMSRSEAAAVVHNFIDIYTPRLLSTDPFVSLSEDERLESVEFFEKFTMQKLYSQCYSMDPNDRIEDERLWIKIRCLDWIEPQHLEISSKVDSELLKGAQEQLHNISKFKAPRDKMFGILNTCRLVVHALEGTGTSPASADDALPLLIYVTIRANPHELWSSIEFIQHFRHPSRHISEEAYAFTLLLSAIEYIKCIGTTTHFKMDIDEFNRRFSEAQEPYMSRLEKLQESQRVRDSGRSLTGSVMLRGTSVLAQLKRIAHPALLFKSVLFNNLAGSEIHEAIESLSALEVYMQDVPLVFTPDGDLTDVSAALLSDWRALTAMRTTALETVSKVKGLLTKLSQ
ncbi:Vacuolar sorting protein 9 (VPS9) domain family protein [Babesia bovis T2Bo]|uniref:Vacuolar sorting protein 9 (VPS9) domain containing protein n=1 Tax=Babesia bovis TaxID=5865 RepID=A7AUN5_BABBO|nr:Vacuolar sorting protein 9 (VPS9) domain family protein [Babesia bovis T2Bo]EDO06646.1 Vacuolar sorting protein 9 (VPS9) domain family protein [Babesia bovis T2Bo]|eukprot:XP_001610214.1 vacuolar sorting protein 9 (VPS9) domain containing protein [Babesia bovis T2Bo]